MQVFDIKSYETGRALQGSKCRERKNTPRIECGHWKSLGKEQRILNGNTEGTSGEAGGKPDKYHPGSK